MWADNERLLLAEGQDSISQLSVEERIQQLTQECEGLVEHSQLLKQHLQRLVEEFKAKQQKSRVLHMDQQKHIQYLRSLQEALHTYREKLQTYLDVHLLLEKSPASCATQGD